MNSPVFATDIRDLAEAFKTLCETSKLTNIPTLDTKSDILKALDETVSKYRSQLKEE